MDILKLEDVKRYNILGLREICSLNREILPNFNLKTRNELEKRIINIINYNNNIIYIPACISSNNTFFKKK